MLLDLGLPRVDGLTLLRQWRDSGMAVPVLVLTARGSWSEKVHGIDSGADDYVAKPYRSKRCWRGRAPSSGARTGTRRRSCAVAASRSIRASRSSRSTARRSR